MLILHKGGENMHASAEDYLETILILSNRNNYVRSIDIVSEMGFSRPSVSIAMRKLRDKRLINVDEHGNITLTESGRETASCVYDKHLTLYNWLRNI